jgi:TPR repeat protein
MRGILLGAWIALLGTVAVADFDDGRLAFMQEDYATAMAEWLPLAEAGDPEAAYWVGSMYASGQGVRIQLREAVKWYRLAADKGHPEAQYHLGFMYRVGNGVTRDETESVQWYRKAAEQGHGYAQFNLGSLYGGGRGVEQDYVQAYKWFSLAAMHGIEEARQALFYCIDHLTEEQVTEARRLALDWRAKTE